MPLRNPGSLLPVALPALVSDERFNLLIINCHLVACFFPRQGGLVGLFSGMSILSLIEIIFWFFKLLQTFPGSSKRSQSGDAAIKMKEGQNNGLEEDEDEGSQTSE